MKMVTLLWLPCVMHLFTYYIYRYSLIIKLIIHKMSVKNFWLLSTFTSQCQTTTVVIK